MSLVNNPIYYIISLTTSSWVLLLKYIVIDIYLQIVM